MYLVIYYLWVKLKTNKENQFRVIVLYEFKMWCQAADTTYTLVLLKC